MIKKTLSISIIALTLSGCAVTDKLVSYIPSFWDDNQSAKIIDIRQSIEKVSCEPGTQATDAANVLKEIQWFEMYSESKGRRQQDVLRIIAPMKETASDWAKRSAEKEGSKTYCELKKKTLKLQASRAAEAVLGRF